MQLIMPWYGWYIIGFVPLILFILSIQSTVKLIQPYNQKIMPSWVWLLLVPIISIFFWFIMTKDLARSIEMELRDRGIPTRATPTYIPGLLLAFCQLGTLLPTIKIYAFLPWLVLFIVYWVQIMKYKRIFKNTQPANNEEVNILSTAPLDI